MTNPTATQPPSRVAELRNVTKTHPAVLAARCAAKAQAARNAWRWNVGVSAGAMATVVFVYAVAFIGG